MVNINEELKAANAAKAAIHVLSTATFRSAALQTLKKAYHIAVLNLSSGGISSGETLNEARGKIGISLSNLCNGHGPTTPERIDKASREIDDWIKELEAARACS